MLRNTLQRVLSALSFYEENTTIRDEFELGDDSMKDTQPMVLRRNEGAQYYYYIGILAYSNELREWRTKARISKEYYATFSDAQTALLRGTYTKTHVKGGE